MSSRFVTTLGGLAIVFFAASFAMQCNRMSSDVISIKSPVNGRYLIDISGNPYSYMPGQKYKITLRSSDDGDQNKFVNFVLLVENSETGNGEIGAGSFQLLGDALTTFHDRCPNAITQTNSIPKSEIQVLWLAPPPNSGCVAFKATVIVSRETWYSEDGPLTLTLCESSEDIDNIEPPILQTCCACHEAKYEVTFESLWSRNTHPKDFPPNNFITKFSDIIGATHSVDYKFWDYGEYASDGLKELAEQGNTKLLERELKNKSDHIRTIIKARGISYPNITGKTFAVFRVDDRHHLMSLVSMIHPSPDWIVGVSSLELCQSNCSWVESKTLNLFPWDAGTDNGSTYLSENSPIYPRDPIRRITIKNPANSPFYDENGTEMKPLARLILSRQRLYEKHNCESPDSKETPNMEEYCAVTDWQEWSPCNVDCGRGTRYRQRTYKLKVVDQHKQRETCKKTLTQRSSCYGTQPECRTESFPVEECELTPWGQWSECSSTCGNGTITRSRRYKTRAGVKHCKQVTNNSPGPRLEENLRCEMPACDWSDMIPSECSDRAWSEWSTCSVTCGKGTKTRIKRPISIHDLNKHSRISRSFDEESQEDTQEAKDNCENVFERVECYNDETPSCDESTIIPALACGLPMNVGLCRSNVDRWHFNDIKRKCELFSYSGCEGNKNNFRTLEMCEHVCADYRRYSINNRTVQRYQFGRAAFAGISPSNNVQNDQGEEENRSGETNDCVVSKWSHWTPCSVSCGKGIKTKTRRILQPAGPGGKACPDKLKKRRKCKIPCTSVVDVDCIMTEWSSWSPCNFSCGPDSVRQRTRNVLQQASGNGVPCPMRTETQACNLSVCPDY